MASTSAACTEEEGVREGGGAGPTDAGLVAGEEEDDRSLLFEQEHVGLPSL